MSELKRSVSRIYWTRPWKNGISGRKTPPGFKFRYYFRDAAIEKLRADNVGLKRSLTETMDTEKLKEQNEALDEQNERYRHELTEQAELVGELREIIVEQKQRLLDEKEVCVVLLEELTKDYRRLVAALNKASGYRDDLMQIERDAYKAAAK